MTYQVNELVTNCESLSESSVQTGHLDAHLYRDEQKTELTIVDLSPSDVLDSIVKFLRASYVSGYRHFLSPNMRCIFAYSNPVSNKGDSANNHLGAKLVIPGDPSISPLSDKDFDYLMSMLSTREQGSRSYQILDSSFVDSRSEYELLPYALVNFLSSVRILGDNYVKFYRRSKSRNGGSPIFRVLSKPNKTRNAKFNSMIDLHNLIRNQDDVNLVKDMCKAYNDNTEYHLRLSS